MMRSLVAVPLLLAAMAMSAPALCATPQRLVYEVQHSRYGTIGTYTNAVETNGDTTTVTTEARIRVSLLGVVLYRQDASRQERWNDGRLVSFRGETRTNGRIVELNGAADGNSFVLNSPEGAIVAPASVRIANPWSPDILRSDVIFTPDRGRLENVQVKESEEAPVTIDGRTVSTKRYEIVRLDGEKRYEIWLDKQGTPVRFIFFLRNGTVTFTLGA